jgi:hypothetical protein
LRIKEQAHATWISIQMGVISMINELDANNHLTWDVNQGKLEEIQLLSTSRWSK